MNYRSVPDFALGLLSTGSTSGRGKAPHTSLLIAENIRVHKGEAEPRPGQSYLDADDLADNDIDCVYEYTREYHALGVMNFYREYLFSAGTELLSWKEGQDYVFHVNEGTPLSSSEVWMAEYMDWAYIGDGVDTPHKYNGSQYFRVGIVKPTAEPTVARNTAVNTDIVHYRRYKYRYVRRVLDVSGNVIDYICSPFSDKTEGEDAFNNRAMNVTLVASADEQVTHIELFATPIVDSPSEFGTALYYLLERTTTNTDQTFTDNIGNIELTNKAEDHPAEDTTVDWDNPPDGLSLFVYYKDRLYGVDVKSNPSVLRYSEIGEPDAWDDDGWIEVRQDDGDVITCLAVRGNSLYIFKKRSIYVIAGDPEAVPMMELVTGGEVTGSQTEFGLGCTAPRSLASYGDDMLIFYNSAYGVYSINAKSIVHLSKNVADIKGLSDESAGVVYIGEGGEPFYVLSSPEGNAFICHIPTGRWVTDSNVNVSCFLVDSQSRTIGGAGKKLNYYYDPDAADDNGIPFTCKIKPQWLNLRDGLMHAVVRGLMIQNHNIVSATVKLFNQDETEQASYDVTDFTEPVGFDGIAGRLFTTEITWTAGNVESLTYLYLKRQGHDG